MFILMISRFKCVRRRVANCLKVLHVRPIVTGNYSGRNLASLEEYYYTSRSVTVIRGFDNENCWQIIIIFKCCKRYNMNE